MDDLPPITRFIAETMSMFDFLTRKIADNKHRPFYSQNKTKIWRVT